MKGFVLAGTVKFLNRQYGDTFSSDLIQAMKRPKDGVYLFAGDYHDKTFGHLIGSAAALLNMPKAELSKIIGAHFFSKLCEFNPSWVDENTNVFELLKTYDMAFDEFVRMTFPDFVANQIICNQISPDRLDVDYRSAYMSGDVAEGLVVAMFNHYEQGFSLERRDRKGTANYNLQFILRRQPSSK